ncbi:MAG: 3-hydroxyacyl-CoA dehydrogenase family protein [Burkholderiales bacterium]|nr:3-hydroxyacyl-CoA dehydrogenase family protein [Burkholderiales bacterium]
MPQNVVVVGAGTMGPSLALVFALHGHGVTLIARSAEALGSAADEAERGAGELAGAALLPVAAEGWRKRLRFDSDLAAAAAGADLVIDAIYEDLSAKQALYATIEPRLASDAILASTTSSIPVAQLAARLADPGRFVVMHFANPPHLMPAVEVVPGEATAAATVAGACAIVESLGKEPIRLARDIAGHLFNRLQFALLREALALVRDGVATPREIDRVVKQGYALRLPIEGPFEKADIAGLPLMASIARFIFPTLDNASAPGELERLIGEGRTGSRAGRGFHDWRDGDARALVDARNAEVIRHLQRLRRTDAR